MDTNSKTCVTCDHFDTDYTGPVCKHITAQALDPIYGNPYSKSCYLMRGEGSACGPAGKLYSGAAEK